MAKPILIANWKNNPGSLVEAKVLLTDLSRKRILYKKTSLVIVPPAPYFDLVSTKAKSYADLGAQDIALEEKGTHTGVITPEILKSFRVKFAIVGHSERRASGESSLQVSQKVRVAFKMGITPIVCFGESVRDSEGEHFEVLREELKASLAGVSSREAVKLILAYEPVWAVGSAAKGVITAQDLAETIIFVRKMLSDMYGRNIAEKIVLLYGGSVDATNAKELVKTGVRGFLVGRASLKGKTFEDLANALTTK